MLCLISMTPCTFNETFCFLNRFSFCNSTRKTILVCYRCLVVFSRWLGDVDCTGGPPFCFRSSPEHVLKGQTVVSETRGEHCSGPLAVDLLYDKFTSAHQRPKSRCGKTRPSLSLFSDVLSIFTWLYCRHPSIHVAIASRTTEAKWAVEALKGFRIPVAGADGQGVCFSEFVSASECYPQNKQNHIRAICRKLKLNLSDLVFYDNLYFNLTDVEALSAQQIGSTRKQGVICVYTPQGLTWETFCKGLETYQTSAGGDT